MSTPTTPDAGAALGTWRVTFTTRGTMVIAGGVDAVDGEVQLAEVDPTGARQLADLLAIVLAVGPTAARQIAAAAESSPIAVVGPRALEDLES